MRAKASATIPTRANLDFTLTVDGGDVRGEAIQAIKDAIHVAYIKAAEAYGFTHRFAGISLRSVTPKVFDARLGFRK